MGATPKSRTTTINANDPWDFARYAVREHRVDLMRRFDLAVGPPSEPMYVLQQEFLDDKMEPVDLKAFVDVCSGLIAADNAAAPSAPIGAIKPKRP